MGGMPGISAITMAAHPAIISAFRDWLSWLLAVVPMSDSAFDRVTIMPVDTAISSAGICETRPSPMVSSVYVLIASPSCMPRWIMPIAMPPTMLMMMIRMPAIASPFTNFEAPSIAP